MRAIAHAGMYVWLVSCPFACPVVGRAYVRACLSVRQCASVPVCLSVCLPDMYMRVCVLVYASVLVCLTVYLSGMCVCMCVRVCLSALCASVRA